MTRAGWRATAAASDPHASDAIGQITRGLAAGQVTTAQLLTFVRSGDTEGLHANLRRT